MLFFSLPRRASAFESIGRKLRTKRQNHVMRMSQLLQIRGQVQGVGFRDALRREALARGCTGWVRNRRDGSVEALVAGEADAVEAVIAWSRRGPPAAQVSGVVVEPAPGDLDRRSMSFDWLPTA